MPQHAPNMLWVCLSSHWMSSEYILIFSKRALTVLWHAPSKYIGRLVKVCSEYAPTNCEYLRDILNILWVPPERTLICILKVRQYAQSCWILRGAENAWSMSATLSVLEFAVGTHWRYNLQDWALWFFIWSFFVVWLNFLLDVLWYLKSWLKFWI